MTISQYTSEVGSRTPSGGARRITQTRTSEPAPQLVTTATTAPVPQTQVYTTAGVHHNVGALRQTNQMRVGPTIEGWDPSRTADYGSLDTRGIQTPGQYGDYLARQYSQVGQDRPTDVGQYIGMVGGRSQWDYQREGIQQQFSDEQERQLEQLDSYLASQGITGGAAAAARAEMMRQSSTQRGQAMMDVNRQEAGWLGEAALSQQAHRQGMEQSAFENAFSADMTFAQLNQRERELAEQARQFNNRQEYEAWATEQGFTSDEIARTWQALQNDEDRRLTAADLQFKIDNMRNDLELDYERLRTSVGIEREQLEYNIWAKQQDLASSERQLQYRTWADQQLAQLNSDLTQERWEDQTSITQRQTSYFNMGKAGVEIPENELQMLRQQDPLAYYAYLDGRAGLSAAVFDANLDMRSTWFKASLTAMSELRGQAFIDAMSGVYRSMDALFGPQGEFYEASPLTQGFPVGAFAYNPYGPTAPTTPRTLVPTTVTGDGVTEVPSPYTGTYSPGDAPEGYVAPTGTVMHGAPAYVTNTPGFPTPDNGVTPVSGTQGSTSLWRGYVPGTNTWTYNNYTPQYAAGTPQAQQFVASPPAADQAYAAHYLYDDATLRAAATTNMQGRESWGPVQINNARLTSSGATWEYSISSLLGNAGRGTISNGVTRGTTPGNVVDPSLFQPVDPEYMDQLMSEGNAEGLIAMGNGHNRFVNIGGQPFVTYQSRDAQGNLLQGVTFMSVTDPTYTIDWIVGGGQAYNPATSSGR